MSTIQKLLYTDRERTSTVKRRHIIEEFASDRSRIVFCSSFRRMMQKAQVFSLEQNTSVRNRLTHSLEVADVGRTIARQVGQGLAEKGIASMEDIACVEAIVESACLIHDIGNPPFGHFGEEAIKKWFSENAPAIFGKTHDTVPLDLSDSRLYDFVNFDGNPQGFRIVTRLHTEIDEHGLNLSYATLLASIKYPNYEKVTEERLFSKKLGVFSSEADLYKNVCQQTGHQAGKRYFIAYLMELADDICYCLSDIADGFEKGIVDSRLFKAELEKIFANMNTDWKLVKGVIPDDPIKNFSQQVAINMSRKCISEAVDHFIPNLDSFIKGEAKELIDSIEMGQVLKCLKAFARRFIYTDAEALKIEIAGHRIVQGLLDHYGALLKVSRDDFAHFAEKGEMRKSSGLDMEWRVFSQLSKRMLKSYQHQLPEGEGEWFDRSRLLVDYISGMTDQSAFRFYQNAMGISLDR